MKTSVYDKIVQILAGFVDLDYWIAKFLERMNLWYLVSENLL